MPLGTDDAARLIALKKARDELLTGRAVASVSSSGRSVSYTPADQDKLNAEIAALESADRGSGQVARGGALRFKY